MKSKAALYQKENPKTKEVKVKVKVKTKPAPMTNKDVSYKSDMVGLPGTAFRKKVEKEIKGKKVESPAKMVKEKATGERYTSKAAMMKHEKSESKAEMTKEYGKPKGPMQKKPSAMKMKKC